jgi:hypothetical protein
MILNRMKPNRTKQRDLQRELAHAKRQLWICRQALQVIANRPPGDHAAELARLSLSALELDESDLQDRAVPSGAWN